MSQTMIHIDHVSKQYRLGQYGETTLRDALQRIHARTHGKEDPTRRIDDSSSIKGDTLLALDKVSFDVQTGERVGIIGRNGAGKSTLLKLVSRITAPTSGRIGLNGKVASMLEVGTGFHQELTGKENIYMNGAILGMTRKEIDKKLNDIIEFSECREFIDTPVKRYSSGMYVKLAFAVAAHLDSEIMIMDEVLAVGDMAFQKKCLDKMNEVSTSEGRTILYVSHNMNTIRQLCNRCIVLDHGTISFDGNVQTAIDIYLRSAFSEAKTYYEYLHRNLKPWSQLSQIASLVSLKLCNKEQPQYEYQEPIRLQIGVKAHHAVNQLCFRIELLSNDGTFIGTAFIEDTGALEKDQTGLFSLCLSTSNIVPGNYFGTIVLYQNTTHRASNDLDYIERAFSFEITDNEHRMPIVWNSEKWGHIMLKDMSLSEMHILT